jgi:hypothetical protein
MTTTHSMRRLVAVVLTAFLGLPMVSEQLAFGQSTGSEMQTVTSRPGRFQVHMPGQPTYRTSQVETKLGPLSTHSYTVEMEGGAYVYMVMYNDYPAAPGNITQFFDAVRNGALGEGRLMKEVELELSGYPGRGMVIEKDSLTFVVADYLVGARLYQLVFVMPTDGTMPAKAKHFFKSFGLLPM